ncbi:hypothetical protein MUK42_28293 [Musa troglodytarum]|uniref:Uncharacterized protein n=1 Tax=Musa troglodytarum TaxID=320322 RepID=A0A9E7EX20_9LILI|nr:hypothetical protein MUK42_28293 [Musa troglodytarum]
MDPITKGGETSAGDGGPMEETDTVLHAAAAEAASFVPPRLEDAGLKDCALGGDSVMEALTRAAISLLPTCIGEDVLDEGHGEALRRKRRCIRQKNEEASDFFRSGRNRYRLIWLLNLFVERSDPMSQSFLTDGHLMHYTSPEKTTMKWSVASLINETIAPVRSLTYVETRGMVADESKLLSSLEFSSAIKISIDDCPSEGMFSGTRNLKSTLLEADCSMAGKSMAVLPSSMLTTLDIVGL